MNWRLRSGLQSSFGLENMTTISASVHGLARADQTPRPVYPASSGGDVGGAAFGAGERGRGGEFGRSGAWRKRMVFGCDTEVFLVGWYGANLPVRPSKFSACFFRPLDLSI